MTLPAPHPGLVVRYSYLWADDAARGREEGDKERPAAIVLSVERFSAGGSGTETRVYLLPITHSEPTAGTQAVEIPAALCSLAGLDAGRAWVVLSEFNEFVWPGYDLAIIPGSNPRNIAYGYLTSGFFAAVRQRWLALVDAGMSTRVPRDE